MPRRSSRRRPTSSGSSPSRWRGTSLFAARFPRRRPRARSSSRAARRRQAHAALGAAEAIGRSPRGRVALSLLPDRARGVPRVPSRRLRPAVARARPPARRVSPYPRHPLRLEDTLPVRDVAPLLVRRQLHLRRRCAAGGAPGAGAHDRSRPATRAPRGDRAPPAPRPDRHRRALSRAPASRSSREARRRIARSPALARGPLARRRSRRVRSPRDEATWIDALEARRRIARVTIAGEERSSRPRTSGATGTRCGVEPPEARRGRSFSP